MNDLHELAGESGAKLSVLDRLILFCLHNKLVVAMVVIFVIGWGLMVAPFDWKLGGLPRNPVPVDAIPDIGENQQIVFTDWMGRSPQDVEDQISYPLTVALLGLPNVKTIRSTSMFGFSVIYVIFDDKVDFYWSRTRVLEKLNSLAPGTLPPGVRPALGPDATALGQIFWYTLEGRDPDGEPTGGWDLHELRTIQDWYVRYALLSADGISEVASVGGFVREYQVDVDPDAMRANRVTLDDVFSAVRKSNVDVGARTIELNRVEYVVRGLGFIKTVADIENSVVKVNDNVPIFIKHIAKVTLGPALRRGALDKEGAEAVGGVVVVRYGYNPLEAIKNVKEKIEQLSKGLPTRAVIDFQKVTRPQVETFAARHGFAAFNGASVNHEAWVKWLRSTPREKWPEWVTTSRVTIVPFYDRTGLIYETLGTLNTALAEEILVTIIVVIVMVLHLRSSLLISGLLPLAVLMCFIAMKVFGVDANIVALSGIAIAIGTMVDMGVIICENILKHLAEAPPGESRMDTVFRASREVASAVLTAVSTTVVSFLPVFTMIGSEGKLFKPLAFTKTFALIASVIVALTIIPPAAHLIIGGRKRSGKTRKGARIGLVAAGVVVAFMLTRWAGVILLLLGAYHLAGDYLPRRIKTVAPWVANAVAVLLVGVLLTEHWVPLGPAKGFARNFLFIGGLIGGLLGFFVIFQHIYGPILRWFLSHKTIFILIPVFLVVAGAFAWLGPGIVFGPAQKASIESLVAPQELDDLVDRALVDRRDKRLLWTAAALEMSAEDFRKALAAAGIEKADAVFRDRSKTKKFLELKAARWGSAEDKSTEVVRNRSLLAKIKWTIAKSWDGLGREFMPDLDEGSFLYMPTTMPHASIGEALDVIAKQDTAFRAIPEIESVVGKIGRAETPLDPAPISMIETVINYKSEYIADKAGRRIRFRYDKKTGKFARDENGRLIVDPRGRPFRQWRDHIRSKDDIWKEIVKAGNIPGTTPAPKLQPIKARIVMLASGMRAPIGVKVYGGDLETIEKTALEIERLLKQVPGVDPSSVIADRIVGKAYVEIDIDRRAIARYGLKVRKVQDAIEVAIGGRRVTTTVEGRERFPVRVRYMRELRDRIETLGRILVASADGAQIPLEQLATIRYVRGPQAIKSEDTFLVGYVLFDKKEGYAEVDVVENCRRFLDEKIASGEFNLPAGVSFKFAGNYENQIRSQKTLSVVLPLALFVIFMILYFQFKSVATTSLVFSGILVAWAGGFILIWLYNQPWFMNFAVFGVNMRELFQMPVIDSVTGDLVGKVALTVAVWVGFLALFGIASDNGVVIATYLDQAFAEHKISCVRDIREATVTGAVRRIRPCLMTSATTILALIPVLTSTGRGSDVMVPMAIPSFGGMLVVLISVFVTPVLYCAVEEVKFRFGRKEGDD